MRKWKENRERNGNRERKENFWFLKFFFLCMASILLTGCNRDVRMSHDMKDVEQRDYATILLITQGEEDDYHFVIGMAQEKVVGEKSMVEEVSEWDAENLEDLAKEYGNVKGKDLSLAHLKVILLDEMCFSDSFDEQVWQEKLLYMLDGEEEIAKTCPMLQIFDYKKVIDFLDEEEAPVGNYIENLVRVKERQGVDVPWLKDYLKAMRENGDMQVMYLEEVGEGWEISR